MGEGVVVIIDDQPLVQIGLKAVLRSMGCSVVSFTSPTEALQKMEKTSPDCILVDLMMPEMDGIEFTKHFRKNFQDTSVPVILSSAHLDNEVLGKAFEAGVDDFLEKPASSVLIRQRVKNMLRMRKLELKQTELQSTIHEIDGVSQSELIASIRVLERNVSKDDSSVSSDMKKAIHVATSALEKICRDTGQANPSKATPTFELNLSTFSPDSLMETCCRSLGNELADKQQTLDCTLDSTLAWMVGDKKLLVRALSIMMTNVIKQSPQKSRIGIRMSQVRGPAIEMSVRTLNGPGRVANTTSQINDSAFSNQECLTSDSCAAEDSFCESVATAHGGGMGYRIVDEGRRECFLTIPLYVNHSDLANIIAGSVSSSARQQMM